MSRFASLALLLAAPLGAAPPHISGIVPIALHGGVNVVPRFLPGGGAATIVEAWRGNGNAHGHHAWIVLTGPSEGNPVGLAPFDHGNDTRDTITDAPFDGERVLGAVRFARARVDGRPASLAITADLDWTDGRPLADHELATLHVYRLTASAGIGPPLAFVEIATLHSTKRYCNADLALRDVLGVPLGKDYVGANAVDGCFAS